MTSTTVAHPALRNRTREQAQASTRRRGLLPGRSTGSFWVLVALVTVLNLFGLVMVMSASSVVSVRETGGAWSYVERQAMWTALGIPALLACLMISLDFWRRFVKVFLFGSIVMLALVLVPGIGVKVNGARRWLGGASLQFQPSEFAKFGLLLFTADVLDRRSTEIDDWRRGLRPVVIALAIVAGLVMKEPNLGTTIIIAAMVLTMLLVAGTPIGPLALTAMAGVVLATASVASSAFRRTRFLRFLNPWADPHNTGLQNIQSMVGLANGGLLGRGLGRSTAKWGFLPYAHTDFIYAVIGEEFGLAGAFATVLLFAGLAVVGVYIALKARDRFSFLVASGITAWLTVQALMNIGAVIGIMPITGVPLPFVSFGGSSLVINLAATGLLLNIARHEVPSVPSERPERRARPARRAR